MGPWTMRSFRLSELAEELDAAWDGDCDPDITGVAGLDTAGPGDITFLGQKRLRDLLERSQAAAVVAAPGVDCPVPALRAEDPQAVFVRVMALFSPPLEVQFPPGIHPTALLDRSASVGEQVAIGPYSVVGAGSRIGDGTALGPHVVIGQDVEIGRDCRFYAQVSIREGCVLGNGVILHSGVVIGSDGFGFLAGAEGRTKIPQIGRVVLEDGVEIGANSCVDRATSGETVIGAGTKIDNLVQIAHNVAIGPHCVISAQTGIAGSCQIGSRVAMGGQVGIGDHRQVGDGAQLAAKSGVHRDVPAGRTVFGYPAFERREAFRMVANVRKLPELLARLHRLEEALSPADSDGED